MTTLTREQAIDRLRRALLELVDDEHSICEVATSKGILCRGFRQFSDAELEQRYHWLLERRGEQGREELEKLANRWQLARQFVQNSSLSCDVQAREHDTCCGWDDFTNHALEGYIREICGEDVIVASP
jgi:hypothetical protein